MGLYTGKKKGLPAGAPAPQLPRHRRGKDGAETAVTTRGEQPRQYVVRGQLVAAGAVVPPRLDGRPDGRRVAAPGRLGAPQGVQARTGA